MNTLKNIGWFLLDVLVWAYDILVWLVKFSLRLIKKIGKFLKKVISHEKVQKNKKRIIIGLVLISGIAFSFWYVFQNYKIAIIPLTKEKQSTAERVFLNSLRRDESKKMDTQSDQQPSKQTGSQINRPSNMDPRTNSKNGPNISNNDKADTDESERRISFRGRVEKIEGDKLMIEDEEAPVIFNEKTRISPTNKKLEVGQSVNVSAHQENGEFIADRISIR